MSPWTLDSAVGGRSKTFVCSYVKWTGLSLGWENFLWSSWQISRVGHCYLHRWWLGQSLRQPEARKEPRLLKQNPRNHKNELLWMALGFQNSLISAGKQVYALFSLPPLVAQKYRHWGGLYPINMKPRIETMSWGDCVTEWKEPQILETNKPHFISMPLT